jgi:hypothetical protein
MEPLRHAVMVPLRHAVMLSGDFQRGGCSCPANHRCAHEHVVNAGARSPGADVARMRPRAIAPNPFEQWAKARTAEPANALRRCHCVIAACCWRRGSVALRGADACDGASANGPGARRQHHVHREGARTMPHCNISRSMRRMRTAKARRPVGQCCQVLRPPCGFFCAAYGVWSSCPATCTTERANPLACNAQCATCNSHDATCDMQPATRGLQLQDAVLHAAQHSTQELHQ